MTPESASEQLLVEVTLRAAQKLLTTFGAEPPDPNGRELASEALRLAFAPIWSRVPFVELSITDGAIVWSEVPVLEARADGEDLIDALRSGGVASLTLVPGVERSEIHQLLLAVHLSRARRGSGLDLPTLLFRADLRLLGYQLDQESATDARAHRRIADEARTGAPEPPPAVLDAVRRDAGSTPGGVVELEKYDSTLYFLDRREIEYLRSAIDREYAQDFATNVLSLLLDTLQLRPEPEVRTEVLDVLTDLLPYLLAEGRFDAVAYLLGETRHVAQGAIDLRPDHKEALDALRASVSDPRAIGQLFHALDGGGVRPTPESMGVLLRELRPAAIRQVLGWSQLLSSAEAEQAVTAALDAFFTEWPHALSRMLKSAEHDVVGAALELVMRLRLPGFVDPVAEVAEHQDASVRALVARSFAAIGNAPALRHLLAMASDSDGSVRVEVWRTFLSRPHRGALGTIEAAITGSGVEKLGRREKRTLFEAYATVAGHEGAGLLESILQGKSPSGPRPSPHTRACAAVALGIIGTPPARAALERATREREPVVRTAARDALRGGG